MLNLKVIGAGAAGNKAAIALIKENGFNKDFVTLINSTPKDIPDEFKENAMIFGSKDRLGGCGKERTIGKELFVKDLRNGIISLDNIADPDTHAVVIVSSTEGGSGSAATPIIAKYLKEVIGIPVIVVLFFGFNTDVRGMQNSIEICQDLQKDYGVIGISNAKFLDITNNNTLKAEQMANRQFCDIIDTISGRYLTPGSQNIDDTDLYKLVCTPGYMMVENSNISKVKNVDQYNKIIQATIDNSTLVDCSIKGAKRIGIIYNISDQMTDNIDMSANVIKDTYGTPYEMFTHVQPSDKNNVIWIAAGMPLPIKELKNIYDNYLTATETVKKDKDSFFDEVAEMKGNKIDSMFNMLTSKPDKTKAKASFFADFEEDIPVVKPKTKKDSTKEY